MLGVVTMAEELRPSTRETVAYFQREDVASRGHLGRRAGHGRLDRRRCRNPLDRWRRSTGAQLPESQDELLERVLESSVVGRISPDGKRRILEALREGGRYAAMVGDGVNDVPALKAARIAIAQGSGSQMARTVSDLVLVKGDFAAVPRMVGEGRQILRNMQRVSRIFATKALFGALVVLTLGLAPIEYPFLPRHLSLASFFVTGVPPFFLALAPSAGSWRMTSYLRDVLRFAVPAAFALALGVGVAYPIARLRLDLSVDASRTGALSVYVVAGLYLIFALEATHRRRALWVGLLCGVLVVAYVAVLAIPFLRDFFEIVVPDGQLSGVTPSASPSRVRGADARRHPPSRVPRLAAPES